MSPSGDAARRVAARVDAERERQGLSVTALAAKAGLSRDGMERRLAQRLSALAFDVDELAAVAAALEVPAAAFLD